MELKLNLTDFNECRLAIMLIGTLHPTLRKSLTPETFLNSKGKPAEDVAGAPATDKKPRGRAAAKPKQEPDGGQDTPPAPSYDHTTELAALKAETSEFLSGLQDNPDEFVKARGGLKGILKENFGVNASSELKPEQVPYARQALKEYINTFVPF